jgi:uncharacterized protein (TIGR02722 family)
MKRNLAGLCLCVIASLAGCATQVVRKDPAEIIDLSGRWNDSDAQMTAEEMIRECLQAAWLGKFNKAEGRDPVVITGTIVNRSHEHIDAGIFVEDISRVLINSGKVRFVASDLDRQEVRQERLDQQENSAEATRALLRQETGADFMLKGDISSIKDEVKGRYAILYQVDLVLIDLTTNEKVWIGQKKIKKLVKNPKYSF